MRKMTPKVRVALTTACLVLAVASLLAASGVTVAALYQNRILPATFVAGVDVSGAQAAEAATTVGQTASNYMSQPVRLTLNDQTAQATLSELGVSINTSGTTSKITNQARSWDWLTYNYWHNFFTKKNVGLDYTIDDQALEKTLQTKFSLAAAAQNASLVATNGALNVQPEVVGATFDLAAIKTSIAKYLAGSSSNTLPVTASTAEPPITTTSATQTKTEITNRIPTVYLIANNQNFNISPGSLYGTITFTPAGDHYTWQIDAGKLASYIDSSIGKKINVTMIQQVVQADGNNTVTTQGVDGKQVDSKTLAASIIAAISNTTNTKASPLAIPVKTIPYTTKTVTPTYTLGLYDGLYLDVSLPKQKMTVINGTTVIAQYGISSGGWSTPTPIGTLYIFNKIPEPYSAEFKLWMPYWNGLATSPDGTGYNGYGIHGLVCWDKACNYREGVGHIGEPVSHGCIRVEDAGIPYIYNNVPIGTPVVIHN